MTRVHTVWSKGDLVRILTVIVHVGEVEVAVERHYADWEKDVTKHNMFISWRIEQDNRWIDQLVRLIKVTRGRSDWRYFRSWEDTEASVTSFCKLAKKAGFTCHKAITLNGEPVGIRSEDVSNAMPA